MSGAIINLYFLAFMFIIGFLIGRLSSKNKMEDLRQNMAGLYLENQALTLKIQELKVKSKKKNLSVV